MTLPKGFGSGGGGGGGGAPRRHGGALGVPAATSGARDRNV